MLVLPFALLSVGSGILLFLISIVELVRIATVALSVRAGIPLSYVFTPHAIDWFYMPVGFFTLLGGIAVIGSFLFILAGKTISRTPGSIAFGFISYTFLYGLVSPLWLLRATADVTFGKNRTWRW